MDFDDLVRRWCPSGTDRPHRLVGDDQPVAPVGQRRRELRGHDVEGAPGVALRRSLADAQHRGHPGVERGRRLGARGRVALAAVGSALAVADEHEARARVRNHRHADIAGMRTGRTRVDVLRADAQPAAGRDPRRPLDQGERRAHRERHRRRPRSACQRGDFRQRRAGAVHFPVADDPHAGER